MRWWRRHHDERERARERAHARADEALAQTDAQLQEARERDAHGWGLADRIRQMRDRNHLGEAIEDAIRGER